MSVRLGVERVLAGDFLGLRSGRIGLIHHQASVTSDLTPSVVALLKAGFDVQVLFGPQHGARGEKQDNMIESGDYIDPATGLRVHSLYGGVRKPTPAMLEGLDFVLFDLQGKGYLGPGLEELEFEDLPDISGLKALRVTIASREETDGPPGPDLRLARSRRFSLETSPRRFPRPTAQPLRWKQEPVVAQWRPRA